MFRMRRTGTSARRVGQALAAVALAAIAAAVPACADDMDFMPDGGRTILTAELADTDADEVRRILATSAAEEDWRQLLSDLRPDLSGPPLDTAAGYAAVNLPLAPDLLAGLDSGAALDDILPPDGKMLAINNCQFCHSLFSGYLVHRRDVTGWLGIFKSPFHSEIPMTEQERETFARYSAINMPLRFEDVPPEYRF